MWITRRPYNITVRFDDANVTGGSYKNMLSPYAILLLRLLQQVTIFSYEMFLHIALAA